MSDEKNHIEQLREDFPDVLGRARISIGSGWEGIVRDLAEDLEGTGAEAIIVKEKFGKLRFQLGPPLIGDDGTWSRPEDIDAVRDRVRKAEGRSGDVCERCGATENVHTLATMSWIKTYCDSCRLEEWKQRKERHAIRGSTPPETITECRERIKDKS